MNTWLEAIHRLTTNEGAMARRLVIAAIGAFMVSNAVGLVNPSFTFLFHGFSVADPSNAAYLFGEVRAVYGGLLAVLGVFTLLSAIDPVASRSRLVLLAWCWLGPGGGRLLGVFLDGDPGLQGWLFITHELAIGALLLYVVRGLPAGGAPSGRQSPASTLGPGTSTRSE